MEAVFAAAVTGAFAVLVSLAPWVSRKLDKAIDKNSNEHGETKSLLEAIDQKLDAHIEWHAHQAPTAQVVVLRDVSEGVAL